MDNFDQLGLYHTGANAIALPLFAVLALLINVVPFQLLYRVKNLAGCTLIVTIAIDNLITLVNSLLWPNDDWSSWFKGVGLCDVEVWIKLPLYTLIATSLCSITRSLARALDTDHAVLHESEGMKRRRRMVDVLFCFSVPFLQLVLHYVVSNARFGIYPVAGCLTFFDASWPTIVIMYMWPPIFTLLNCYYAVLVILRLRKHRNSFTSTLASSGSGLSPRRFLKLFVLSIVLLLIYLPLSAYYFYVNIPSRLYRYSWSIIHDPTTWSPIEFYHSWENVASQYDGWAGIGTALAIFLFFGVNDEAITIYRRLLVQCGFGRCWPSLTQPKQPLAGPGSASSTTSWHSKFDVVGKAMKYFENGSRTSSTSATRSMPSTLNQPRQSSLSLSDDLSCIKKTTPTTRSNNVKISLLRPDTVPTPRNPSLSMFSTFRTHITLPTLPLGRASRVRLSTHDPHNVDLEAGPTTRTGKDANGREGLVPPGAAVLAAKDVKKMMEMAEHNIVVVKELQIGYDHGGGMDLGEKEIMEWDA